jgi:hypothetical protein
MKKLYFTLSCLMAATMVQAQLAQKPAFETQQYPHQETNTPVQNGNRVVVWSEDFNGGWPAGWTIQDQSGICPWKWSIGGSWGYFNGNNATAAGTAIASTTAANGFIINDPDSANHATYGQPSGTMYQYLNTYFTTSAINTTGFNNVLLEFQQFFRFNNTLNLEVHVSNDSITWTTYNVQGSAANNTASPNAETVSLNISPVAGNQPTVYLKIGWNARVYYWMIDDMQIIEAPDDDLKLVNATWENTNLMSTGFPVKYTRVPTTCVAPITFSGEIVNYGGNAQTATQLDIDVRDATTSYFTGSSTAANLNPSDTNSATVLGYTPAATIRNYDFIYTADYTNSGLDASPENNTDTLDFMVTENEYARDNNTYSTLGLWNGTGNPYVMGNTYQIMANDFEINAVRAAFTVNTDSLIIAYAEIYEIDQATGDFLLIATSASTQYELELHTEHISSGGVIKWVDLQIPSTTLLAGGEYIVAVGHYGGPEDMTLMYGNKSEEQTTFLLDGTDNTWYYLTNTPMIRAVFVEGIGVEEELALNFSLGNCVPNPATETTTITYTLNNAGAVSFEIRDITGKLISTENSGMISAGQHTQTISVTGFAPGVYFYTLIVNGERQTRKLVVR